MASNLGPGVSRVLDPNGREFLEVILQQGKPPMDAEFNLLQELATDITRKAVLRGTPSGWLGNETNLTADFKTDPTWSNWFKFGSQRTGEKQSVMWAVVNGWMVPVTATRTGTPPGLPNDTDTTNVIALDPPPANSGDFRTDFVFLEVWQARVAPNPSTANKPSSSALFRYGNVESGNTFLPDDLIDPALGFETSQRVQLQYRIRVVKGLLAMSSYPDGFDPSVVKAKGAYDPTNPDTATSWTFQNMRKDLGDAGLWRAGDGTANNLGTVDGYVYAIPLCAVFRRNAVAWNGDPAPNLNGAFNRNPTAIDRSGVKTFSTLPVLASALSDTATSLTLALAANIPLPSSPATPVYIRIGDEIMTYQTVTGTTVGGLTRGVTVAGTVAVRHAAGSTVQVLSGRPDGLYADQVAATDILDLRHAVNPNGFNYQTLLRYNFDKLLRGELRSNWKRSGNGTQGPFVFYQDKITSGAAALGVDKLDAPDGIRMVYSDAITVQPVELILTPKSGVAPQNYSTVWGLQLQASRISAVAGEVASAQFLPGTVIEIPVSQLKSTVMGVDADQIRWCDELDYRVEVRIDGDPNPLDPSTYMVSPFPLTSADNLAITLQANFPTTTRQLYVKLYVLYGAGRGISRRPDMVHSLDLLSPSSLIMHMGAQYPALNYRMSTSWAFSWSKFRSPANNNPILPITAETYYDQGSRTVIVQPYRLLDWPDEFRTLDGTAANFDPSVAAYRSGVTGVLNGTTTFQAVGQDFTLAPIVSAGMALILTGGSKPGRYTVVQVAPGGNVDQLLLERPAGSTVGEVGIGYDLRPAQGLMPLLSRSGAPKWTMGTDPLGLFSGTTDPSAATKNLYCALPPHLVPFGGDVYCPILAQDAVTNFDEGVNFMFNSTKGANPSDSEKNYVPYSNGTYTYAQFTTLDLNFPFTNPAPYNTAVPTPSVNFAGMRKFSDPTPRGRKGLQLPPFYGIARLFGVYGALEYKDRSSPYSPSTRDRTGLAGTANNLLKQGFEGPTFWVEVDADGDATFILNADAIDLAKCNSLYPITSFDSGDFVIEANIFGFDRDAFALNPNANDFYRRREVRLVLTRVTGSPLMRTQANDPVRTKNLTDATISKIAGPVGVLPGPMTSADSVLVNYSRVPYGGDAWGTTANNIDIGHKVGPLLSSVASQLVSIPLNPNALTRPNQKPFEVLASMTFSTSAGTGRMGGTVSASGFAIAYPGYEDTTAYPPSLPVAPRPNFALGAIENEPDNILYISKYTGCTERLPMGALWRDKDFRAVSFSMWPGHIQTEQHGSLGAFPGFPAAGAHNPEMLGMVETCDSSMEPGTVIVHVDGNQTDYSINTNYRTNRGGSGFIASGSTPGGYLGPGYVGFGVPRNSVTNVLAGAAYLVRNAPTNKGATEVSAGGELMLVVTTEMMPTYGAIFGGPPVPFRSYISTTGAGEGYAAVDYYRIEGHPIMNDNVRANIDPATISLAPNIIPPRT
jgi:hypothetical protein